MGTHNNPGQYDCLAHAEPDEPMFVLLARDVAAPAAIEDWADLRAKMVRHGQKPETDWPMIAEARHCAQAMREWRRKNRPLFTQIAPPPKPLTREEFDAKVVVIIAAHLRTADAHPPAEEIAERIQHWFAAGQPRNTGIDVAVAVATALYGERP